jgi:ABC-type glycerol-3-phosphate transport system substrate-binding protein
MTRIDRSYPLPIYYQLKTLIKQRVDAGEWKPGEQIPTEEELCEYYGISRTPVRQALLELTREGVLTRTVGRGTFVADGEREASVLRAVVPDARWQQLLEAAARVWNESHPAERLRWDFTIVPLWDLHDHLALAVAQGEAPDISVLDSVWIAEFAFRRYLYALNELDAGWAKEAAAEFFPSLLAANSYRGELYGVQTNADAAVLWYRRDWLAAENLSAPRTWDELLAAGRHFQQPAIRARYDLGPHPLVFVGGRAGGETTTYQLLPLVWSAGGRLVEDGRVALDSDATRQALSFLDRLVHIEQIAPPVVTVWPWDGALRAFAGGQAVLALGGTYENFLIQHAAGWDTETFRRRVGFVPIPASGRAPVTLAGGMTFVVYRQSGQAARALELLKLALTPAILVPFSQETGQNPSLVTTTSAVRNGDSSFLSQTAELLAEARTRPSLPAYDRISAQFQEMVELCLTRKLPIDAAVRRAAERIGGVTGFPLA